MLSALRIQNFAVIEKLEVHFASGFNVLTGETGAGKSVIIDALHLILGGRARLELIRTGEEEASVEALFENLDIKNRLDSLGIATFAEKGELLIRRVVCRSGRGRVWVNGSIVSVGLLEKVVRGLLDISGQHEHVSLLEPALHLSLLDAYAGLNVEASSYKKIYECLVAKSNEKAQLESDTAERARRADYISFQLEELDRINPQPREDEQLLQERRRLAAADRLKAAAIESEALLNSGDRSAIDMLSSVLGRIADAAILEPGLEPLVCSLETAKVEIEETARSLAQYARNLDFDSAGLSRLEDRLEELKTLCRKHGGDLEAVLRRKVELREELNCVDKHSEYLSKLEKETQELNIQARELAQNLSQKRRLAANRFAQAVEEELKKLSMGNTRFRVSFRGTKLSEKETLVPGEVALTAQGIDQCELLLSPNPGEDLKPLARIASGGELSRVMLAIKRVLANADPVDTYVFDEVDSGIGGTVAQVVGNLLREISKERQVICITHLPQIAACAQSHFVVKKIMHGGRTMSSIEPLNENGRTLEISRMLAGAEITPAVMQTAQEMIEASALRHRGKHDSLLAG